MTVRPSDVFVVSFPKCGTTWAQELVWQVANGIDLEGGKTDLMERFPFMEFLEWDAFGNDFNPANYKTLEQLDSRSEVIFKKSSNHYGQLDLGVCYQ